MSRQKPIVPHIARFHNRCLPYTLPKVERMEVLYSTPCTVRGKREECNNPEGKASLEEESLKIGEVYCLPSEQDWIEMQRQYGLLEASFTHLMIQLDQMGSYREKIEGAHDLRMLPARLSATVIKAPDTDLDMGYSSLWESDLWAVPKVERVGIEKHTPKKIRYANGVIVNQGNHFICETDQDWETLNGLYQGAIKQHKQWIDYLKGLGSYQDAEADGRYKVRMPSLFL